MLTEIYHLKKDSAVRYTRKNENIRPFESGGETSLEFFSLKTDCSIFVVSRNLCSFRTFFFLFAVECIVLSLLHFKDKDCQQRVFKWLSVVVSWQLIKLICLIPSLWMELSRPKGMEPILLLMPAASVYLHRCTYLNLYLLHMECMLLRVKNTD